MLVFRIIGTEGGTWLLVVAGLIELSVLIPSRHRRLRLAAGLMSGVAGVLVIIPLLSLPWTIRATDAEFARVFGTMPLAHLPFPQHGPMRLVPFSVQDSLLGIPTGAMKATPLTLSGADGQPLPAWRYGDIMPEGKRPILVVIHGGGWHGGSISECSTCQRYLAGHGYLVYSIGYRLAPATRFPGQLDDVQTEITWIAAHGADVGGDPARIVLMGRSAGAELALVAAYAGKGPAVCGVISWYGPTDLVGGYRHPPRPDPINVRLLIRDYMGGKPEAEPLRYARASPTTYATHPLPPTLLIAGGSDHAVLIGFQRRLRDRLMRSGTTVALLELPWAEHAFDRIPDGPGAQVSLYYLERFLAWATSR